MDLSPRNGKNSLISKASFLSVDNDRDLAKRRLKFSLSLNTSINSNISRISDGSDRSTDHPDIVRARHLRRKMSRTLSLRPSSFKPLMIRTLFTKEDIREKLCYAIRMVRFSVRLHLALKVYSRQRDKDSGQSLDQLNYYSMESEFTTETLVFSKSYFSASNVVYMPAWARIVLATSPADRTQADIARLASLIRRFFNKTFLEDNLLYLCKNCAYTRYEKKRVLIRRGHRPLYCYLLFSGSVFVNIEEQDKSSGKKYYRTESVLKSGAVFGEIGVIHNMPRTATIVSRENIECLSIPPEVCKRVFPEETDRDYKHRLDYMRESELFADWPNEALEQLCLVSKMQEYSYNEVVDKNTGNSEFIYMVAKGRVEIMSYVDLSGDGCRAAVAEHSFLPPIPVPRPKLLPSNSTDGTEASDRMIVSIDFLYPFQCCDLLSLVKHGRQSLILISRGAEVIRFPKLRLKTIPPLKCWKKIIDSAKASPRFPGNKVLSRLCMEHCQWTVYKRLVLSDSLDNTRGRFHAMKPETSKTAIQKPTLCEDNDDDIAFVADDFSCCLQNKAPLHDLVRHQHKGPCIQTWNCFSKDGHKPSTRARSLSTER